MVEQIIIPVNMKTRVSVVIPTRDRRELLFECLERLQKQLVKPYEVVIVCNGSTSTLKRTDLVRKFPHIKLRVLNIPEASYSRTHNIGVNAAKGSIVAMIDDDCLANKYWVQEIIRTHSQGEFVVQGVNYLNGLPKNLYSTLHNLRSREAVIETQYNVPKYTSSHSASMTPVRLFDPKNVSFPRKLLTVFPKLFADWLPPEISVDDFELAHRLVLRNIPIVFNKNIVVFHKGRSTLHSYLYRNFEYGRNDWWARIIVKNDFSPGLFEWWVASTVQSWAKVLHVNKKIIGYLFSLKKFGLRSKIVGLILYTTAKIFRISGYFYEGFVFYNTGRWKEHGATHYSGSEIIY